MADWVKRLAELVSFPRSLHLAPDWARAQDRLEVTLPTDYKRLVEHFGSGEFDGYMGLLVPAAENPVLDLFERNAEFNAILDENPDYRRFYQPYPIFPEAGGLLGWAYCGYGQRFYWLTEGGDPDLWPVIAWQDRGPENFRFDGSTAEFMCRLLAEELEISFIPEREIEGPLTFKP